MCMTPFEHSLRFRELDRTFRHVGPELQRQPGWVVRLLRLIWSRPPVPVGNVIGVPA